MKKIIMLIKLLAVLFKSTCLKFIARATEVIKDNSGQSHPVELSIKQMTESLARTFYPAIVEFFEKEENQKEFEQWLAKRKLKNQTATD